MLYCFTPAQYCHSASPLTPLHAIALPLKVIYVIKNSITPAENQYLVTSFFIIFHPNITKTTFIMTLGSYRELTILTCLECM